MGPQLHCSESAVEAQRALVAPDDVQVQGRLPWVWTRPAATGRRFGYHGAAFFHTLADWLSAAWVLGDLASLRQQPAGPQH